MPSFNATHPELLPGEEFYLNIRDTEKSNVLMHQERNNPEYEWRVGDKAYTGKGDLLNGYLPVFRKIKPKTPK